VKRLEAAILHSGVIAYSFGRTRLVLFKGAGVRNWN